MISQKSMFDAPVTQFLQQSIESVKMRQLVRIVGQRVVFSFATGGADPFSGPLVGAHRQADRRSHGAQLVEEIVERQIVEGIVHAIRPVPQERSHQRIVEQSVLFLVPQIVGDLIWSYQITSWERISKGHVEQGVDVPVSQSLEQLVEEVAEVAEIAPRECVECISERIDEQVVDVFAVLCVRKEPGDQESCRRARFEAVGSNARLDIM